MATPHDEAELGQPESAQRTGPSLLQVAWQRKSLVILGLMLGLILGLLYYAQRQPVYQSSAQILVVKKTPDNPLQLPYAQQGQFMVMDDYMATQSVLLKSPLVIGKTVEKPIMKSLLSFRNDNDGEVVAAIRDALTVARDSRETAGGIPTNVLTASLRGPIADECPKVLEALVQSYQDFLNDTYQNVSEKAAQFIMNAQATLKNELQGAQKEYYDLCLQQPTLLLWSTQGGGNMYSDRLAKIEKRRSDLSIELSELQSNYRQIEEIYKKDGKGVALQVLQGIGVKLPWMEATTTLDQKYMELLVKKKTYSTLGANHPLVKELDEMLELIKKMYGRGAAITLQGDQTPLPTPENGSHGAPVEVDTMQIILASMRAQMDSIKQRLQAFERQFELEQKDAVDLATFQTKLQLKKENLESSKHLFELILQRAQEVKLVKAQENGGYEARMIHPPGLGRKIAPNPLQVFPLSAILGLAAGVGLAYLAELSDKSFRTPAEIRRRLGLPVIGHIPFFDSDEAASKIAASGAQPDVDPMVIAHYQTNSIAAEAYRGVRTALYFNSQGVGHQVIQVTSPNVSDGKSTLAANLAVSIAQSGKRTILIDGDCRKPKVHKFFNVSQETGLASVIAGTVDLDAAVKQSAVPNLSILPCGPRPVNPAELLTSPRFKELLDMIRSRYEFVIVDTPPLLVVTDPCVVAPRVDGVVLTIRVTKNGRPYAERAKEILASLGANVIGVVVNGFGGGAGGRYGYEHYQYGYGYGYGYSYSYSYGYKEDEQAKSYYRTADGGKIEKAKS